jgi:hypothetical protein
VAAVGSRDVADVVRPHPSMRGGAAVVTWRTRGASMGGDVAAVGVGDVACWWALVSAMNAPSLSPCGRSRGGTAAAGMRVVVVVTRGMMGNVWQHLLPNIAIINNQCCNY